MELPNNPITKLDLKTAVKYVMTQMEMHEEWTLLKKWNLECSMM